MSAPCVRTGAHLIRDDGRCAMCLLQIVPPSRFANYRELWCEVWRAVAFAMRFEVIGECGTCGCRIEACDYCLSECFGLW